MMMKKRRMKRQATINCACKRDAVSYDFTLECGSGHKGLSIGISMKWKTRLLSLSLS